MEVEEIIQIFWLFLGLFCGIIFAVKRGCIMKHLMLFVSLSLVSFGAFAANNGRPAMSNKIMAAPQRYTASVNQLNAMSNVGGGNLNSVDEVEVVKAEQEKVDMREAERNACINNNIGIGNTFVWASKYSDTSNYANMVEDVNNPENNVCFVRVELKSDNESRIAVSDVPAKYFQWGETIECGSWVDEKEMRERILDAKKGARIGGIVASTVGGAGLGVGAMELFGNKAIGGKVQGQKAKNMQGDTLYRSILLTYQNSNKEEDKQKLKKIVEALKVMKEACSEEGSKPEECSEYAELIAEFAE